MAAEEARATRIHAQAGRGIAAETLALTGLRGATLAASAPFLAGATAAIVFSKAIREASDQTEELNKVAVVFGDSAKEVEDFAKTTARSLGVSEVEALRATGIFGNLFRAIHIGQPEAAAMSVTLVKLAADLASFNNADPTRTLEALRAGLVGQARPLRVFGAFLTAARVQQEALIETGKKSVKDITERNKVQARYNLILQDTVLAQGDVERTQGRLANQSRILKAQLSDLGAELGKILLPAALFTVQGFNDLIDEINLANDKIEAFESTIGHFASDVARLSPVQFVIEVITKFPGGGESGSDFFKKFKADLEVGIGAAAIATGAATSEIGVGLPVAAAGTVLLAKGLHDLDKSADDAAASEGRLSDALDAGGRAARLAAFAIVAASRATKDLGSVLRGLEVQRLQIQTGLAPGGRGAEEANLRKQIDDDKKAVALSKSGTRARKEALLQLKADQDDLAALLQQDAQDAENRASKIQAAAAAQEQAARESAQAQADATQAFIEQFSGRQQRLQNRLTTAETFGTAKQQIAINKLIVAADAAEIKALQDRIRHLHLHDAALKAAQAEIARLQQEIFDTQNAIIQLQRERKQAIADARQSHLEAQLAIAETTASTRDDVAAEKALIKFDQQQIRRILAIKRRRRLTQDEAAQLDAYRVDLAQRNAALKKTTEEVQDTGKKFKELTFAFLQTQAGFAANLLGNLIPGFATTGLVGGQTGQPGARAGDNLSLGLPAQAVSADVQGSAALAAGRERGVRSVQVDTTNQLLRHILKALQNLNGRVGHPEARYQKATGSAQFDTL